MDSNEFSKVRKALRKTQGELARLLSVSPKAIKSFEQGWRKVPASVERQLILLVSLKLFLDKKHSPCWEIRDCPAEWRALCPAWEYKAGHLCWFINGTFCQGKFQDNWDKKMELCRQCEVLKSTLV